MEIPKTILNNCEVKVREKTDIVKSKVDRSDWLAHFFTVNQEQQLIDDFE